MAQHRLELEAQAKMIKTLEAELSKRQEINAEQIERLIEERNSEIKNLIREQSKEIHEKNVKIAKFEIKDYANIFRQISKNIFTNKGECMFLLYWKIAKISCENFDRK